MSTSIDEGIENLEERLASLKALREKYPRAMFRDGYWWIDGPRGDANVILRLDDNVVAAVQVGASYALINWTQMSLVELFDKCERGHPKVYAQLVDIIARRTPEKR